MFRKDLGDGFVIVPAVTVSMNGLYSRMRNSAAVNYDGEVCLMLPDGKAAMDQDGERCYVYESIAACEAEAEILKELLSVPLKHSRYLGAEPKPKKKSKTKRVS